MAGEFTGRLREPRDVTGSIPAGQSTAAAIGAGLAGVANILDVGLEASREAKRDDALLDIENKLRSEIDAFTGDQGQESIPEQAAPNVIERAELPSLVGEDGEVNQEALSADPQFQSAVRGMDRIRQATEQGRMRSSESISRMSSLVQEAINRNPRFAPEIRERARSVLGFSPSEQLIALQMSEEAATREQNEAILQSYNQVADQFGVPMKLKADGTPDTAWRAAAGMALQANQAQLNQRIQELEIMRLEGQIAAQGAGGGELAQWEYENQKEQLIVSQIDPNFELHIDPALDELQAAISSAVEEGDAESQQLAFRAVGNIRTHWMRDVRETLRNAGNIEQSIVDKILARYESEFAVFDEWATGGLSALETGMRVNQQITEATKSQFFDTMPITANLMAVFGQAGGELAVNTLLSAGSPVGAALVEESAASGTEQFFRGAPRPSPGEILNVSAGVASGDIPITETPHGFYRAGVIRTNIAPFNYYMDNLDTIGEGELDTFGNIAWSMATEGLETNELQDIQSAASLMQGDRFLRAFNKLKENPQGGQSPEFLGVAVAQLHTRNIQESLSQAQSETVRLSEAVRPVSAAEAAGSFMGNVTPQKLVDVSLVYNPETGLAELMVQDRETLATVTGERRRRAINGASDGIKDSLSAVNTSLDTISSMQEYTEQGLTGLNDLQFRQQLVMSMGRVRRKPGTELVDMPRTAQQSVPESLDNPFNQGIQFVLQTEGESVATEPTGERSRFGIMESNSPTGDLESLTREDATQYYFEEYWQPLNLGNVPQDLAIAAFDAAVNQGPARARRWLEASNYDLDTFILLRRAHYEQLARDNPEKFGQFLEGWHNRLNNLESMLRQQFASDNTIVADLEVTDG